MRIITLSSHQPSWLGFQLATFVRLVERLAFLRNTMPDGTQVMVGQTTLYFLYQQLSLFIILYHFYHPSLLMIDQHVALPSSTATACRVCATGS
eukprot:m.144263 g.144263  ORF g.144263 m.144263 type:complete len:94 (+) comp16190_c0_seq2:707-988(+)